MPKRKDINSILIIGSGPIIIGQACEFDYSGTQALRALKEEGYRTILVNSNPATIMTDPEIADASYIEPLTSEYLEKIIEIERPDAILATLGGQTALNCALDLNAKGILNKYDVQLIGVSVKAIECAENRDFFQQTMKKIGLEVPKSIKVKNKEEAKKALDELGLPVIIRSSFSLGGSGAGVAYNEEDFFNICENAFQSSSFQEIMLDEALIGWKEFELEVVRDYKDNCIVVCGVENIDPLGIHTGDSITVAPIQTLTDKEYQKMRQAAFDVLRIVGVETGGSNVQFAVNPATGRMVVIEMNPRVSRSSALVSKASGFPIAKIAAKLAVGYSLDELKNDITGGKLPASFEPSLDYVVIKIPRFHDEKFKGTKKSRGPQMKSVGEVMSIGRTFPEALQKAICSLELGSKGFDILQGVSNDELKDELAIFGPKHIWAVGEALRRGYSIEEIFEITKIDPWFLSEIKQIIDQEEKLKQLTEISREDLLITKKLGFTDGRIAELINYKESNVRKLRVDYSIAPVYKHVDSCAGEFYTPTSYLYHTYEDKCEANPTTKKKVLILGSGPNRIGQGIEFDYCCVQAIKAFAERGYETIMINCNPETVSTDYDIVDRLYFVPIIFEYIIDIIALEKPEAVVLQFGGQTPLKLAKDLSDAGINLFGLDLEIIEATENRDKFRSLLQKLDLKQPKNITVTSVSEAEKLVDQIGFPLIIRPSFVLGGEGMFIVHDQNSLNEKLTDIFAVSSYPVLLEKFLLDAIEIDVDAVSDGKDVFIPTLLEHFELAGIHSGDSACITPPQNISIALENAIRYQASKIIRGLNIVGIVNMQFAIQGQEIYIIEVNPRASRTTPFTSKATGFPLIKIAINCVLGISLEDQKFLERVELPYYSIKESVLPFKKFPMSSIGLGPEMKSTGEVMGIGRSVEEAFLKAQISSGNNLPDSGLIWIVGFEEYQEKVQDWTNRLKDKGYTINCETKDVAKLTDEPVLIFALNIPGKIKEYSSKAARYAIDKGIAYSTTVEMCKHIISTLEIKSTLRPSVAAIQELYKTVSHQYNTKHLLTGEELTPKEVINLINQAIDLKTNRQNEKSGTQLAGKTLAMIFDKPSFRTRFSFAIAIQELGGFFIESTTDNRKQEDHKDMVGVLNGFSDIVAIRTHDDEILTDMSKAAKIPIINALSALHHPCQIFADLMTIKEVFGYLDGITLAYIGDGNNILNSLLLLAPQLGVNINYCCPTEFAPAEEILKRAHMRKAGANINSFNDPSAAVANVDVVYTDVWTSMGYESRDHYFEGYCVDEELMKKAKPTAAFMHCMPMEKGKEVSVDMPYMPCSIIFKQSENRLHIQKALLLLLLKLNSKISSINAAE